MPSIVIIKSAQSQNHFMEKFPDEGDLIPTGETMGVPSGDRGQAPMPEQVQWADDDPDDGMEVTPSSPGAFKQIADENFLPVEDKPQIEPEKSFDEVTGPKSPIEEANEKLGTREKIWYALNNPGVPLRMIYTSLGGFTTERTVEPDYVYWAGTHRHVMVSWCRLRNDWRAFIVDRITEAKLEDKNGQPNEPIQ